MVQRTAHRTTGRPCVPIQSKWMHVGFQRTAVCCNRGTAMRLDKTTIATIGLCVVAIIAALYARNLIYPQAAARPDAQWSALGSDPYAGGRITIHYHERPPYYITYGNSVGGIIGDRINFVFEQAGIPLAWQKTPAARQLDILKKNARREGAAGWFRTPEREQFTKFSWPIYQDRPTVALTRADQKTLHSGMGLGAAVSDQHLRLLRKKGYSYGPHIDGMLDRHTPAQLVTETDNLGMLKMIHTHRADYFFIAEEEANDLLARTDLSATAFRIVTFADIPAGNRRYILFSRRVERTTIERLNRVIRHYGVDAPDTGAPPDDA